MSPHINFAKALGIESLAGTIVFTVLYVPLLAFFAIKSFTQPTYVHYVLAFFCTIRVAAFAIRTVLAASESAAESLGLAVADETLFAVGYFGLLFSAYILVLDRMLLSDLPRPRHPLLKLSQDRRLIRLAILVPLVLGIVAATLTDSNGTASLSTKILRVISTALFLILTALQTFQTIYLATSRISTRSSYYVRNKNFLGVRYGNSILLLISVLLLVRETFTTATVNTTKQNNEHFWYPFIAVPEILVIMLYTTPGVVPRNDEVSSYASALGI